MTSQVASSRIVESLLCQKGFTGKKTLTVRAQSSKRLSRKAIQCSSERKVKNERSIAQNILLSLVGTGLAAGIAMTSVLPQEAMAEVTFQILEPQAIALIAEAEVAEESVSSKSDVNDPFERANKLKAILAEKKREAEEKAAALKAENEAIFKAEREKLALEASKAPERTPEIKPEIVVVSPVSAPVEKKSSPAPVVVNSTPSSPTVPSKKSRGGVPLPLAQILVLTSFGGVAYGAIKVPASTWDSISSALESTSATVTPKIEEAWATSKPVVEQGVETAKKLAVEAQPYVEKAIETAKPLALEAIEKAKPVLKEGQEKAISLFSEAQEKLKAKLNSSGSAEVK